jgi:hypothetical protein
MARTALLIRCTVSQAGRIREESQKANQTISAYVLHSVRKVMSVDDRIFAKLRYHQSLEGTFKREPSLSPRTAILVRCNVEEGDQIRQAARRRSIALNAYVLRALKMVWSQTFAPTLLDASQVTEVADGTSSTTN